MSTLFNMLASSPQRIPVGTEEGLLKQASFTLLELHANCNYSAYLRNTIPYEQAQEKMSKVPAIARGTELHDATELFIKGHAEELDPRIKHQRDYIEHIASLREDGIINPRCEDKWRFDREWGVVESAKESRLLIKPDMYFFETPQIMTIDEWKTGKAMGNEAKHTRQIKAYAVAAFMKFPDLQFVNAAVRYFDQNFAMKRAYTREQAMAFMRTLDNQLRLFWHDTKYVPKPSSQRCAKCPYNERNEDGSYDCPYGVRND